MSDRGPGGQRRFGVTAPTLALIAIAAVLFTGSDLPGLEDFRPRADDRRAPRTAPNPRVAWGSLAKGEARTAHLKRGFKVALYDEPGGHVIGHVGPRTQFGSRPALWVAKRSGRGGRWLGVPSPARLDGELSWLRLDHRQLRFGSTPYSLHVDLGKRTVELRRRGALVHRATVTIGRAGVETPTGRFAVTDTIREGLLPVYGCCVIALSARQAKTPQDWPGGDRIAIHGTVGEVGGAESYGCLRAGNPDMRRLMRHVAPGVPVLIS